MEFNSGMKEFVPPGEKLFPIPFQKGFPCQGIKQDVTEVVQWAYGVKMTSYRRFIMSYARWEVFCL